MLLPIRLRELIATVSDALRLHLAHDDLTRYNAVQRTLYVGRRSRAWRTPRAGGNLRAWGLN
jgi:hypothetical protein